MRFNAAMLAGVLVVLSLARMAVAAGDDGRVLKVVRDFEDAAVGEVRPAVLYWSWTPEQKAEAGIYSSVEVVNGAAVGEKCLKLGVTEALPPRDPGYRMLSLGVDYLPPEADAVRMRVKVLQGQFTFSVGGPTVYFGHSDAQTRRVSADAATHGEWTTVEFDLHEGLTRNFRRSQWAHNAPIIYYARWIQEPMGIEVMRGSVGEILIDQVELIAHGNGRPFPTFTAEQITPVGPVQSFEDPASMNETFTVMASVTDVPDFTKPAYAVRRDWAPPKLARVAERPAGGHALEITMRGTEEVCFAGMKLAGAPGANAIAMAVKAEHADRTSVVLDFVAYAAPVGQQGAFPWDELRPPVSWRESPHAFTYYLSPRMEAVKPVSFGLYHVRRVVPRNEWTTLILPLADFLCFYGQGEMQDAFAHQRTLAGEQVFALTVLSYYGQRSAPTRILIDELRPVVVPGGPEEHRSYHLQPAP